MDSKACSKCQVTKTIDNFSKQGKAPWCKACSNEYAKQYRANNKDKIKHANKEYHKNNKEKKKDYDKRRLAYVRERDRERYATDMNFRLRKVLRTRLYKTIKGIKTSTSILSYLGVDIVVFKNFLEYQFSNNMSWDNYAVVWEIDHVEPCSYFDLVDDDEKRKCFVWTNMRPLLKDHNRSKSDTYDELVVEQHKLVVEKFLKSAQYQVNTECVDGVELHHGMVKT